MGSGRETCCSVFQLRKFQISANLNTNRAHWCPGGLRGIIHSPQNSQYLFCVSQCRFTAFEEHFHNPLRADLITTRPPVDITERLWGLADYAVHALFQRHGLKI